MINKVHPGFIVWIDRALVEQYISGLIDGWGSYQEEAGEVVHVDTVIAELDDLLTWLKKIPHEQNKN